MMAKKKNSFTKDGGNHCYNFQVEKQTAVLQEISALSHTHHWFQEFRLVTCFLFNPAVVTVVAYKSYRPLCSPHASTKTSVWITFYLERQVVGRMWSRWSRSWVKLLIDYSLTEAVAQHPAHACKCSVSLGRYRSVWMLTTFDTHHCSQSRNVNSLSNLHKNLPFVLLYLNLVCVTLISMTLRKYLFFEEHDILHVC